MLELVPELFKVDASSPSPFGSFTHSSRPSTPPLPRCSVRIRAICQAPCSRGHPTPRLC
ncbi:hypothetical protein B0O99DRAFT_644445 [Bisporella sp. PMI_857]|nr:hypothetical protein B0O99DRAFT_644445 [Bisporella sp. PMI_857]